MKFLKFLISTFMFLGNLGLFSLRYVLERLTRCRQDQMFKLLRPLIRFVPRLPQ